MQNAGKGGSRAYLAVSGGIDVPEYLGSRATFPSGKLGGLQASALPFGAAAAMLVSAHYHQVALYGGMLPLALPCGLLSTGACKYHTAACLMVADVCLQGRKLVAGDVLLLAPIDAGAIVADLSIPDPWLPSYRGQP